MTDRRLITGQTLSFINHPFQVPPEQSARHIRRGAVLIENGVIAAVDDADTLRALAPDVIVEDMGEALILPGFIDALCPLSAERHNR